MGAAGGCGKTFLLTVLVELTERWSVALSGPSPFASYSSRVLVMAPTGMAASLLPSGQTYHSALGLRQNQRGGVVPSSSSGPNEQLLRDRCRNLCAIFLDEISMVSDQAFEAISARLGVLRNDPRPFGGVDVFIFGDLYQLTPVCTSYNSVCSATLLLLARPPLPGLLVLMFRVHPGVHLRGLQVGAPVVFRSRLWQSLVAYLELTENMRQAGDRGFIELLNRLRVGARTAEDHVLLRSRLASTVGRRPVSDSPIATPPHLYGTRAAVGHRNQAMGDALQRLSLHQPPQSQLPSAVPHSLPQQLPADRSGLA